MDELPESGRREARVIGNALVGGAVAPACRTIAVQQMMSAPPAGLDSGNEVEVGSYASPYSRAHIRCRHVGLLVLV